MVRAGGSCPRADGRGRGRPARCTRRVEGVRRTRISASRLRLGSVARVAARGPLDVREPAQGDDTPPRAGRSDLWGRCRPSGSRLGSGVRADGRDSQGRQSSDTARPRGRAGHRRLRSRWVGGTGLRACCLERHVVVRRCRDGRRRPGVRARRDVRRETIARRAPNHRPGRPPPRRGLAGRRRVGLEGRASRRSNRRAGARVRPGREPPRFPLSGGAMLERFRVWRHPRKGVRCGN